MKAMILAAGKGERMKPLSDSIPKPLLLVKGKPLIVHHINNLKLAGINDIIINVHHLADKIQQYLGDGERYNVKITYSHEQELLDTGGGIYNALTFFKREPFIVVSADIYTDYNLLNLKENFVNGLAHLVLVKNPIYHRTGDFGLVDTLVTLKDEKLKSSYTYANLCVLKPEIFNSLAVNGSLNATVNSVKDSSVSGNSVKDIIHNNSAASHAVNMNNAPMIFPLVKVFKAAIQNDMVSGEIYTGKWFNIGTQEQLAEVNAL